MMKTRTIVSLASALTAFGLTGCSSFHYTALPAVGPDPTAQNGAQRHGRLEVYTAYATRTDNQYKLPSAHTDYTVFLDDTWFSKRVHNSRNVDHGRPQLVMLSPGTYNVSAQASAANGATFHIVLPVVIEAGRITKVYLDGQWRPRDLSTSAQLVRLPSGEPVGWSADK